MRGGGGGLPRSDSENVILLQSSMSLFMLLVRVSLASAMLGVCVEGCPWTRRPHAAYHRKHSNATLLPLLPLQILVKDNWGSTMSLVISATGSVSSSVFFIAFVILASIMFTNLFIGIVCAVFVRNAKISNKCVTPSTLSPPPPNIHRHIRSHKHAYMHT